MFTRTEYDKQYVEYEISQLRTLLDSGSISQGMYEWQCKRWREYLPQEDRKEVEA